MQAMGVIKGTVIEIGSDHENPERSMVKIQHKNLSTSKIYLPIESVRDFGALLYRQVVIKFEAAELPSEDEEKDE